MAIVKMGSTFDQGASPNLYQTADVPNPSYPGDPASDPFQGGGSYSPSPVETPRPGPSPGPGPQPAPSMGWQAAPSDPVGSPTWISNWLNDWSHHPGVNPSVGNDPNYWNSVFARPGGAVTPQNQAYYEHLFMRPEGAPENWQSGGPGQAGWGTPSGGGYGGTNVFSDPASQQWEQLLNSLVGKLNTPYTPPGFQPMIDQLSKYFQQLQGPAYTPAQMDLIQTQSTDPLMQSRDHARQQILQNFASRGMDPNSPIVQSALEQSDQKYGVANTQAQAGFATNAIGLDRQNAATAAQVGPQIAGLQQGLYNYNLGNAGQAVNYANQVPTTAWNRLTGANSLIQPLVPSQLAQQQILAQQQGYGQNNDYTSILMQILSGLFR